MDEITRRINRNKLLALLAELERIEKELHATPPYTNLYLPEGIPKINEFIWKRLDAEAKKHGDFIIVTDLGYSHNKLYIDIETKYPASDFDWDGFVDFMINQTSY